MISIIVATNGQEFRGAGATLEEALSEITIPDQIKTKTVIKVTVDGRTFERPFRAWQVNKIFRGNEISREIQTKNLEILCGIK